MSKLLYLDVETTGLDDEDRLCEVCYKLEDGVMSTELFCPPLPIKVGAMAVSHITNKMVEEKEPFAGSDMWEKLTQFSNSGYILVAHNAPFDLKMLEREGIVFENYIDTKKLSHRLDKDDSMESHRLQYLRYYYGIEMPEAVAHSAEGDVNVLHAVHEKLVEQLDGISIEEQIEISKNPVLFSKFKFGKYNGSLIADVARTNPNYLEWLLDSKKNSGQVEEDWIYTLEHYLRNHA